MYIPAALQSRQSMECTLSPHTLVTRDKNDVTEFEIFYKWTIFKQDSFHFGTSLWHWFLTLTFCLRKCVYDINCDCDVGIVALWLWHSHGHYLKRCCDFDIPILQWLWHWSLTLWHCDWDIVTAKVSFWHCVCEVIVTLCYSDFVIKQILTTTSWLWKWQKVTSYYMVTLSCK